MIAIAVQAADFDTGQEIHQLQADRTDVGGIAIFTGQVRDTGDKPLGFMHLEHYPDMTESSLQQTAELAMQRWPLLDIRIVHRIGDLLPGDQIVFVGVSSVHRESAFNACEFIMDHLKTHALFWKKEYYRDGSTKWVEAKQTDQQRNARWDQHD